MTTTKAQIIKFTYAGFEFNGLLMPNGAKALSVSQLSELFQFDKNQASRDIKRILGKGFQFDKTSSELNPKAVNVISLSDFKKLVRALDKKGNVVAERIAEAAIELSIEIAFDSALGIERTTRDYQSDFEALVKSKECRLNLTDTWKHCYELTGEFPTYGKHTLDTYKRIGLVEKYNEWKSSYTDKERRDYTFRHHFLDKSDRDIITTAETNIKFMIEKLDMTVEEAIEKL